jgi:hypothetical protein
MCCRVGKEKRSSREMGERILPHAGTRIGGGDYGDEHSAVSERSG